MLERYRDVMNQIHMPDDCDWKIRSAMEKKARETHRRRPLRRISLAAAVVAILVTTALAATFLRSQTFQEMLGREAVQWEDQIQEARRGPSPISFCIYWSSWTSTEEPKTGTVPHRASQGRFCRAG